jgi:hypothetical protein
MFIESYLCTELMSYKVKFHELWDLLYNAKNKVRKLNKNDKVLIIINYTVLF